MNFEEFRIDLESKISQFTKFELQEFNYLPYFMGSGCLIYRINGRIFKFFYDGREGDITCERSERHIKYHGHDNNLNLVEITRLYGLNHNSETWKKIIESN